MNPIKESYHIPLILLVSFLVFFPHLDVLYISIMEARNFDVAREMLHHDNWIFTTMNGEPRYEKPPLPTWITALFGKMFGLQDLWILRLPAAMIATLLSVFMYKLGLALKLSKSHAFNATLIYLSTFYIILTARSGTWDIFAHCFIIIGLYFLTHYFNKDTKVGLNAVLAGLFFGLSFMSKGPVSHYVLLLPFVVAYIWVFGFASWRYKWKWGVVMLLVFLVVALWWPLMIFFLDKELAHNTINEETQAWTDRNVRPFFYYWSFTFQSGLWMFMSLFALFYRYLSKRVENPKMYLFSVIWTLGALILLSIIPEKKTRYLLPALIPLAYTTSFYVQFVINNMPTIKEKWAKFPTYLTFGGLSILSVITPIVFLLILYKKLAGFWIWFALLSVSFFIIAILIYKFISKDKVREPFYLSILLIVAAVNFGYPLVRITYTNADYAALEPRLEILQKEQLPIYYFENGSAELVWSLGKRYPLIIKNGKSSIPEGEHIVILDKGVDSEFKELFSGRKVEFMEAVDTNISPKHGHNYKDRKIAMIYKVY